MIKNEFVKRANSIHNNKYDYSNLLDNVDIHNKIKINRLSVRSMNLPNFNGII